MKRTEGKFATKGSAGIGTREYSARHPCLLPPDLLTCVRHDSRFRSNFSDIEEDKCGGKY